MTTDATSDSNSSTGDSSVSPVEKLTDTQVFARDPEDYTTENLADTIARLERIIARQRKARQDDAEVAEQVAKIKKANAANKKMRAKKPVDFTETTI